MDHSTQAFVTFQTGPAVWCQGPSLLPSPTTLPSPRSPPRSARGTTQAAELWSGLSEGRLRWSQSHGHDARDEASLVARLVAAGDDGERTARPLGEHQARVLTGFLCGEQQKVLAADMGLSPSTVSHHYRGALGKLGLGSRTVPLPLIVTVQTAFGIVTAPVVRFARCATPDGTEVTIAVRRPDMRCARELTPTEQTVAGLFIEGRSRTEIAVRRGTSAATVDRQVHAIFAKLRLFGRYALVRRGAELGCFD